MKRFSFRLQNVLKWRLLQLELEEEKLQELFGELQRLLDLRGSLEAAKAEAERSVLGAQAVAAYELVALDSHRRWVAARQQRLARQAHECQIRIDAQRERVRKAEQDLKLLEKLRERRHGQWSAEVDKAYQALAEEVYLAQWQRRG